MKTVTIHMAQIAEDGSRFNVWTAESEVRYVPHKGAQHEGKVMPTDYKVWHTSRWRRIYRRVLDGQHLLLRGKNQEVLITGLEAA